MPRRLSAPVSLAFALAACSPPGDAGPEPTAQRAAASTKVCPPAKTVKGTDVAPVFQDPVDWKKVAASGRSFVLLEATNGTKTPANFTNDAKAARAAGVVVGLYHVLSYEQSGAGQAAAYLKAIGGAPTAGDLPPILDLSDDTSASGTPSARVTVVKDWLAAVEAKVGRKPILYSNTNEWTSSLGSPSGFASYPIWWAELNVDCPSVPDGLTSIVFWQKSFSASIAGLSAMADDDVFYGDLDALRAFAKGAASGTGGAGGAGGTGGGNGDAGGGAADGQSGGAGVAGSDAGQPPSSAGGGGGQPGAIDGSGGAAADGSEATGDEGTGGSSTGVPTRDMTITTDSSSGGSCDVGPRGRPRAAAAFALLALVGLARARRGTERRG